MYRDYVAGENPPPSPKTESFHEMLPPRLFRAAPPPPPRTGPSLPRLRQAPHKTLHLHQWTPGNSSSLQRTRATSAAPLSCASAVPGHRSGISGGSVGGGRRTGAEAGRPRSERRGAGLQDAVGRAEWGAAGSRAWRRAVDSAAS